MKEENYEFELKLPKSYLYFAIAVVVASVGIVIGYSVRFALGGVDKVVFGLIVGVACAFVICGIIGSYMLSAEKFSLKDGVFEYTTAFKKKQSVALKDVSKVKVCDSRHKNMQDISFVNAHGDVLMKFTDAGMVLDQAIFVRVIDHYKIPFDQNAD